MTEFIVFVIYAAANLLNCVTSYATVYHIRHLGWPTIGWVTLLGLIYLGAITYVPLGAVAFVDLAAKTDPQSDLYVYARDIFFIANMGLVLLVLIHASMGARPRKVAKAGGV